MSEPKGRGTAWTEERRRSDEGRTRLESGPEASECSSGVCITCSDTAVQVTVLRLVEDEMAVVDAGVGDTILVHAREAIAVVGAGNGH